MVCINKKLHFLLLLFCVSLLACTNHPATSSQKSEKKYLKVSSGQSAEYYFLLSRLADHDHYREASLKLLDMALNKNLHSPYLLANKAYLLAQAGKFDEAFELARQALASNPNSVENNLLMGKILAARGEREPAMIHYQQAALLDPTNEEAVTLLAREYIEQDKVDIGIKFLKKLSEVNPEALNGLFYLGNIYATKKKDLKSALKTYQTILNSDPDNLRVLELVAEIYLAEQNYTKALENFEKISDQIPSDISVQIKIALLHYELKQTDKAILEFEEILKSSPKSDRILYYLGVLYAEKFNTPLALHYFSQIPESSKFYDEVQVRQLLLYKDEGQLAEGIRFAKEQTNKHSNHSLSYQLLATAYAFDNNLTAAINVLEQAQKKFPQDESILSALAQFYEKSGNSDRALAIMQKVIRLNPKNFMALNFVGYSLAEKGENLEEAERLIRSANKLAPSDPFILDSLGWVLFLNNKPEEALTFILKASEQLSDEPEILEHLGDITLRLQDGVKAKDYYQKAKNILEEMPNRNPADNVLLQNLNNKIKNLEDLQ